MHSHTLALGAQMTAPSPSSCLERDLKTMINFYLVLFYATLILLSRQVCRLPCPASAEQTVQRAVACDSNIAEAFHKGLVVVYTGLGGVGSTTCRLVQHPGYQAWVACHRCDR